MVIMNIVIICFLGNHIRNALQNPDKMLVASNKFDDSFDKSHQYKLNVYPNINPNLYKREPAILPSNQLINKNNSYMEPNEMNFTTDLLEYVFTLMFKQSLKWYFESNQNYSDKENKNNNNTTIVGKASGKAESLRMSATQQNGHEMDNINNIFHRRESNLESSTDFKISSLLDKIRNFTDNKFLEPSEKPILNNDEKKVIFSSEKSQNSLILDTLGIKSSGGRQEVDISVQSSVNESGNRKIYSKQKIEATIFKSSFIKVQQLKYKHSFNFRPQLFKIFLTNSYQYDSPTITLRRALMPRTLVKRSAITRQLETPEVGNFPFSTAGSSLYGSYAYAHTRPSGFGGEGGELGVPIEGGEEDVQPTEGGAE